MKKTIAIHCGYLFNMLCAACICTGLFFLSSCGLDEYYILEEPTVTYNLSYASTESISDYQYWYVDFLTNDRGNSQYYNGASDFVYLGTSIYYKVYNDITKLLSEKNAILNVNSTSNYGAAATKMIETYGYKPLKTYPSSTDDPFVGASSSNQRVIIRLNSYQTTDELKAKISIAGTVLTNTDGSYIIPVRNGSWSSYHSFDFFDNDDSDDDSKHDVEPVDGDDDFRCTASSSITSSEFDYYVQLFAVAVGRDSNYTYSYSLVLNIGSIPIQNE